MTTSATDCKESLDLSVEAFTELHRQIFKLRFLANAAINYSLAITADLQGKSAFEAYRVLFVEDENGVVEDIMLRHKFDELIDGKLVPTDKTAVMTEYAENILANVAETIATATESRPKFDFKTNQFGFVHNADITFIRTETVDGKTQTVEDLSPRVEYAREFIQRTIATN